MFSLRRRYLISFILLGLFSALIFILFTFIHEKKELKNSIESIRNESLNRQKTYVKNKCYQFIQTIQNLRESGFVSQDSLKEFILQMAAGSRMEYGGYVFINQYDGKALVFDGKKVEGEKYIKNMTDPDGKKLFTMEINAVAKPDGDWMSYKFKRIDSDLPEDKLSYVMGIQDWQWIVGVGIYLEDLKPQISAREEEAQNEYLFSLKWTGIYILALLLIVLLIAYRFNKLLKTQIDHFVDFFKNINKDDHHFNLDNLRIKEFSVIALAINKMLDERAEARRKISLSEAKYKTLIQEAADAILIVQPDGKIINTNSSLQDLTGYRAEDLLNMSVEGLFDPQSVEECPFKKNELEGGKKIIAERRILTKAGVKVPVEMHTSKIGNNIYMSIIRDISIKKKYEGELKEYQFNLEEKVKSRTIELEQLNAEILKKNAELERFNQLFVGREIKMAELKKRIAELEQRN